MLRPFHDIPTNGGLPEWKIRSIRGRSVKSYYHPIPDDDFIFRTKGLPFNQNDTINKYNSRIRDRYVRGDIKIDVAPQIPASLQASNIPRPKRDKRIYPKTREQKTGLKDPEFRNNSAAPRNRKNPPPISLTYTNLPKPRDNQDTHKVKQDRINTADTLHHPMVRMDTRTSNMRDRHNIITPIEVNRMNRNYEKYNVRNPYKSNPAGLRKNRGFITSINDTVRGPAPPGYRPPTQRSLTEQAVYRRNMDTRLNHRGVGTVSTRYNNRQNLLEKDYSQVPVFSHEKSMNYVKGPPRFSANNDFMDRINARLSITRPY